MYGFLQLITDGNPNKHPRKTKNKGTKRRKYKRTPSKKNTSITFGSELEMEMGFPN